MARPGRTTQSVSLFPFLAVLVCAMGALIFLLLVTTRRIRSDAVERAAEQQIVESSETDLPTTPPREPSALPVAPPVAPPIAPLFHWEARKRPTIRSRTTPSDRHSGNPVPAVPLSVAGAMPLAHGPIDQAIPIERLTPPTTVDPTAERQARLHSAQTLKQATLAALAERKSLWQQLQDEHSELTRQTQSLADELEALTNQRAVLKQQQSETRQAGGSLIKRMQQAELELEQRKEQARAQQTKYAILPFDGQTGTVRRPILIECLEDGFRFLPEDIELSPGDFDGFVPEYNPLLAGTRALISYWSDRQRENPDDDFGAPYVLLIVRPSGTIGYYAARRLLQNLGTDFGYELVEEDATLDLPKSTPEAEQACREAIRSLEAHRAEIVARVQRSRDRAGDELFADPREPELKPGERRIRLTPNGNVIVEEGDRTAADGTAAGARPGSVAGNRIPGGVAAGSPGRPVPDRRYPHLAQRANGTPTGPGAFGAPASAGPATSDLPSATGAPRRLPLPNAPSTVSTAPDSTAPDSTRRRPGSRGGFTQPGDQPGRPQNSPSPLGAPSAIAQAGTPTTGTPTTGTPTTGTPTTGTPTSGTPTSGTPLRGGSPQSAALGPGASDTRDSLQAAMQPGAPPSSAPQSNAPPSNAPQSNAPQSNAPQSNAPQSNAPQSNAPQSTAAADAVGPFSPHSPSPQPLSPRQHGNAIARYPQGETRTHGDTTRGAAPGSHGPLREHASAGRTSADASTDKSVGDTYGESGSSTGRSSTSNPSTGAASTGAASTGSPSTGGSSPERGSNSPAASGQGGAAGGAGQASLTFGGQSSRDRRTSGRLRQRTWGIVGRNGSIGFEREVTVYVTDSIFRVGRLTVPASSAQRTEAVTQRLAEALDAHARQWGPPPNNFYWVPAVQFVVSPGGESNYERVRGAIQRLGLTTNMTPAQPQSSPSTRDRRDGRE